MTTGVLEIRPGFSHPPKIDNRLKLVSRLEGEKKLNSNLCVFMGVLESVPRLWRVDGLFSVVILYLPAEWRQLRPFPLFLISSKFFFQKKC